MIYLQTTYRCIANLLTVDDLMCQVYDQGAVKSEGINGHIYLPTLQL